MNIRAARSAGWLTRMADVALRSAWPIRPCIRVVQLLPSPLLPTVSRDPRPDHRPAPLAQRLQIVGDWRLRQGFTLIEVLVATTLTLMLIGAVVSVFQMVGNSVSDARSTVEMSDRLRATAMQLQRDLSGVTVTMLPPRRPEDNEGYFEYVENSILTTSYSGPNTVLRPDRDRSATPYAYTPYAVNTETEGDDTTVGDTDDILMFTTRSPDRPFVGQFGLPTDLRNVIESQVAEVAWFMRGRTLYRRILLVTPGVTIPDDPRGFYENYDISIHAEAVEGGRSHRLVPNTLADLTKREFRFAHPFRVKESVLNRTSPASSWPHPFPFDIRRWEQLRLPTLWETSDRNWLACDSFPETGPPANVRSYPQLVTTDLWHGPDGLRFPPIPDPGSWEAAVAAVIAYSNQFRISNPCCPANLSGVGERVSWRGRLWDDVILTNVLAFDVKAWDAGTPLFARTVRGPAGTRTVVVAPGDPGYPNPAASAGQLGTPVGYGAYADLGYLPNYTPRSGYPLARFHVGNYDVPNGPRSGLYRVYDTWSTHYEHDGITQYGGRTDWATDGLDNDGKNGVDDAGERETQPPYPYPLRSIQVKIRSFDPDSRQIREVTIVHDFMPQ